MNWTDQHERVMQTFIHDPRETLLEMACFYQLPIAFVRARMAISIANTFYGKKSVREIKDLCKKCGIDYEDVLYALECRML